MRRQLTAILHAPPPQLLMRLWLVCKRRALEACYRVLPRPGLPSPPPRSSTPLPPLKHPRVRTELPPGDHLARLLQHAMEDLPLLDDAAFEQRLRAWIERHPPYGRRYWEDSWNSWALSIRAVVWMHELERRSLTPELRAMAHASLRQQLEFLLANLELDIRGNHLVKNVRALLTAGRYFEGSLGRRCRAVGQRHLARIPEQFRQGLHFENSPAYHCQVVADLLDVDAPVPPEALRAVAELTHPDGGISLFNDGGLSMGIPPEVPAREVFFYEGYAGLKRGGTHLIYDFGPLCPDALPAHSHGDIFSFELSVGGLRFVVDPGVYQYQPGPWRSYSRSTLAHNTVSLDRQDQGEFFSSFRVGRRARTRVLARETRPDGFSLEAEHDGYARLAGRPIHRRRVEAGFHRFEVEDEIRAGRGQRAEASLLLHPEVAAAPRAGGCTLRRGDTVVELETAAHLELRRSWWCPDLGRRIPAPRLVLDYGKAPCRGTFLLWWQAN